MTFVVITYIVSMFFAMNMGGSGAAASIGIAYGSGAIRNKRIALAFCALGIFLGSVIGGGEVVKTMGSGIIPSSVITMNIAIIILAAATSTLFFANLLGIPLSTSEVTVGSIVGVGIAYHSVYLSKLFTIVMSWIFFPLASFILIYLGSKVIRKIEQYFPSLKESKWKKRLMILLVITGFFEAFSAGMNNVSNAIGPLVGAGMISIKDGVLLGGVFIALGAFVLGGKVVETNGKKITNLSLLEGSLISGTGSVLVIIASIFGIPIPITQITTGGILGSGLGKVGGHFWQNAIIKRMLKVWIVSPLLSLVISYGLVLAFNYADYYTLSIIGCVFLVTIGLRSLLPARKQRVVSQPKVSDIEMTAITRSEKQIGGNVL